MRTTSLPGHGALNFATVIRHNLSRLEIAEAHGEPEYDGPLLARFEAEQYGARFVVTVEEVPRSE